MLYLGKAEIKREGVKTYFVVVQCIMQGGREGGSLLFLIFLKWEMEELNEECSAIPQPPFPVPSTLFPPSFLLHLLGANYTAVIALLDPWHV